MSSIVYDAETYLNVSVNFTSNAKILAQNVTQLSNNVKDFYQIVSPFLSALNITSDIRFINNTFLLNHAQKINTNSGENFMAFSSLSTNLIMSSISSIK